MATSGVTTGLLTAGQIIDTAFTLLAETAAGDALSGDEYDYGLRALSYMLKSWCSFDNLWREEDADIAWPAATREGSLSPIIIDVMDVRYDDGTTERQLTRYDRARYNLLPEKDQADTAPIAWNFVKETTNPLLRLWPVPTDAVTLKATVLRTTEDVTDIAQTVDMPQEWTEAVYYNLADRLAPALGKWSINPATVADIKARAAQLYRQLRDPDRDGSIFLTPWGP